MDIEKVMNKKLSVFSFLQNHKMILSILLLGLINGIIFFTIIPPWWHYDEPGHFEYAWMMANDPGSMHAGVINKQFRIDLAHSLENHGWYEVRNYKPDFNSNDPLWIGVSQVGDEPGYYYLLSLPLRLLKNTSIDFQYNICRLFSFFLFLLTIYLAWKIATSVFSSNNPITWMIPVFISILPGFVDTMLSVSNDVAAIFSVTLFLYASVKILNHKINPRSILLFLFSLVCCYFSKNIAWFGLILAPPVMLFAVLPRRFHVYILSMITIGLIAIALLSLDLNGSSHWYITASTAAQGKEKTVNAPDGNYAQYEIVKTTSINSLQGQSLPPDTIIPLRNHEITLGLWIWADQVTQIYNPDIYFIVGGQQTTPENSRISVDTNPHFFTFSFHVPPEATRGNLVLHPQIKELSNTKIYYDNIVLVDGNFSGSPATTSKDSSTLLWNGIQTVNLIQNGSFESETIHLKPWVEKLGYKIPFVAGNMSLILSSLIDPRSFGWFYRDTLGLMFRTFWGDIAGFKVNLPGRFTYPFIFFLMLLSMIGFVRKLWLSRRHFRVDFAVIMLLSMILIMGATLVRGTASVLNVDALLSWARYFLPAIIPISIILCTGWLEFFNVVKPVFKINNHQGFAIYLSLLYALFFGSTLAAVEYFHPQWIEYGYILIGLTAILGLYQVLSLCLKKMDY